ncbi:hypothetical protein [Nocardia arthritidis]|uniref:Uncharacterized protein n=1 Tax=Nocardia arthritidis TaxID=228602 RepID=A0A6G9YDG2_9NOCA|nr:hypothetical protein [Nocardia arthritidis]QIS11170.1 hypothetical protein F5544_16455 [Nocardia arthritidis]
MAEQNTDRPLCPQCGMAMTPIEYGKATYAAYESAERGEIILGGCVVSPDSPDWGCRMCRTDADDADVPSFMRGRSG